LKFASKKGGIETTILEKGMNYQKEIVEEKNC
jgi:hypothetical protein